MSDISDLEKYATLLYCSNLKDISSILESVDRNSLEKEKFINDVKDASLDKDTIESIKIEDNIDYRFTACTEAGIEQGIEQGIQQGTEQTKLDMIRNMLKKNLSYETISEISGKSIEEIKTIEDSM